MKITSTTIVAQFSNKVSTGGVVDMSGNVWKWTKSWYDEDQDTFVVRGGSSVFESWYARCSDRSRLSPVIRHHDVGFRIVVSLADSEC